MKVPEINAKIIFPKNIPGNERDSNRIVLGAIVRGGGGGGNCFGGNCPVGNFPPWNVLDPSESLNLAQANITETI